MNTCQRKTFLGNKYDTTIEREQNTETKETEREGEREKKEELIVLKISFSSNHSFFPITMKNIFLRGKTDIRREKRGIEEMRELMRLTLIVLRQKYYQDKKVLIDTNIRTKNRPEIKQLWLSYEI